MKTKKTTITLLMATAIMTLLAGTSCQELPDGNAVSDPGKGAVTPLQIEVTAVPTRSVITGTQLPSGAAVGLMLNDGTATYDSKTYSNIKATASGSGASQMWALASDILLSATEGTLYSYHPYSASVTDFTSVPVETASITDYMWGTPVTGLDMSDPSASVTMNHALAAVKLNLTKGTYAGALSLSSWSVTTAAAATSAVLDATTGDLKSIQGKGNALQGAETTLTAVPTGESAAALLTFTVDGRTFQLETPAFSLEQGQMAVLNVTMNDSGTPQTEVEIGIWSMDAEGVKHTTSSSGHKVSIAGDTDGIVFQMQGGSDGSVTVTAWPTDSDTMIETISSTGTATFSESLDYDDFSVTTTISDIQSDVVLTYSGLRNKIDADNYLTIEALEDGLTASLSVNACEYCINRDGNWRSLEAGTTTEAVKTGYLLSFRGNLTPASAKGIGTFTVSRQFNLKGDCMSMIYGDDAKDTYSLESKDYAFYKLFYNCTNLKNCDSNFLKATTLATRCYYYMFYGCTGLTQAPELPATTLANHCYSFMFQGCTGLTQAPVLPATTLTGSCYNYMFSGCTGLTQAPELPATTLATRCYFRMFSGCTGLTTAPELPATTLAQNCYTYMFQGCTGLTQAPELPATTLADDCYTYMFQGCTGLTQAPELPATTLAVSCYQYMFSGCTGLTTAPELPATTLAQNCYTYMFMHCEKLNYIKMLATDISATNCLLDWVKGVAASGIFVKHPDMNSLPSGTSGIPEGWTVRTLGNNGGSND